MARSLLVPLSATLAALWGAAAPSGLLVPEAPPRIARRRSNDEGDIAAQPRVVSTKIRGSHIVQGSHRPHSLTHSHLSHYSGARGTHMSDREAHQPP